MALAPTTFFPGQGVVSADNLNTFMQCVSTVAQLRTFTGLLGMSVWLEGYYVAGDTGSGVFSWNPDILNAVDDNGATTVVPNGTTSGCWTRALGTYQINPGGAVRTGFAQLGNFLVQFGQFTTSGTTGSANFPVAFPFSVFQVVVMPGAVTGGLYALTALTNSGFSIGQANSATVSFGYIAVGF